MKTILPHISRRALKRVKSPLPVPTNCPYCNGEVSLVNNSEIYGGREFGEWPYAYLCKACDAYVGLHPHTDIPLGTIANRTLRTARNNHKTSFLELQKTKGWSRTEAYAWLADQLGIAVGECHFGWFDQGQCVIAGQLCAAEIAKVEA